MSGFLARLGVSLGLPGIASFGLGWTHDGAFELPFFPACPPPHRAELTAPRYEARTDLARAVADVLRLRLEAGLERVAVWATVDVPRSRAEMGAPLAFALVVVATRAELEALGALAEPAGPAGVAEGEGEAGAATDDPRVDATPFDDC